MGLLKEYDFHGKMGYANKMYPIYSIAQWQPWESLYETLRSLKEYNVYRILVRQWSTSKNKMPQLTCLALFLEPSVGRGNLSWALSPALLAGYTKNALPKCSLPKHFSELYLHFSELYLQWATMKDEEMSHTCLCLATKWWVPQIWSPFAAAKSDMW